jgi:hypothetical protein
MSSPARAVFLLSYLSLREDIKTKKRQATANLMAINLKVGISAMAFLTTTKVVPQMNVTINKDKSALSCSFLVFSIAPPNSL